MKKAFTLIELIMVIVILGIISVIGTDIVGTMYTNYLKSKTVNYLESQSAITLELIEKRLSHRVRGSEAVIRGTVVHPLSDQNDTDTILTWIGVSSESQKADGWSGLVDFNNTNTSGLNRRIASPGTDLAEADSIITLLTNGNVNFSGSRRPAFIPKTSKMTDVTQFYNNTNTNYTIRVGQMAGNNGVFEYPAGEGLPVYPDGTIGITNEYYLSHTAYALTLTGSPSDANLWLHYNYQPWNGDTFANGQTQLLAQHVSTFRFLRYGGAIRLKLCLNDANLTSDSSMSACKETVVF